MSRLSHTVFLAVMIAAGVAALYFLVQTGYSYYHQSFTERPFHENHELLKPGGSFGHGYGILGSLCMLLGVTVYMIRKRFRSLNRLGSLKYWLEFHIFLCSVGPLLVLFHTAFKFGGLVAISFWSMTAVFLSGIIGRFIYIRLPRASDGRELSMDEITELQFSGDESTLKDKLLNQRPEQLEKLKNLFRYWHVAHLPFALVMLIIMIIHVAVTIVFGYRWIF